MREESHPLDRPLPHDVAAGESAFIQFYQKYAVFSWHWAWRRTVLFGSLGVLAGVSFGITHGLFVADVGQGIVVSLACAAANVVLVGAGPMLAAIFRHSSWAPRTQRAFIVGAVIGGVFLGALSGEWASDFHDRQMAAHGHGAATPKRQAPESHAFVRHALNVSRDLLILVVASGGLALPAFFSEKKRWADHRRRIELEKLSAQKSETDLKLTVLQAQVEPHFLFNTLASVRSLVSTDPQRAAQTIDALALHLRATLPKLRAGTGTTQSTLGEQFAICASYLDLMKCRLADRLEIELRLPEELHDAPFPPLLLISLVENAIKHGAESKPGTTRVTLAARVVSGAAIEHIEVLVEDDGAGLRMGMGEGTGLANIRAQLITRFGANASLELSQRSSGGASARLLVPLERGA
jgi:hypothetical protein